ncbi:SIR2 family protein-dependent protein deacetylase [Pseudomonas syringae pv. philadelphi]|uniref:SIR2 family protein-dependent protein deacetylase n=1 Tax=Pseudomonas syringae pv. philadelphi TaxID=251706 RepID=A0A3M3ZU10_9PSED|nr:SIR2 family protein-dependent protein deacetylase [Pseudomonas syringae pv. philadelphi]
MVDVKNCDVLFSVGASGFVSPAADIPEIALASGAIVIHVNIADACLEAPNELMLMSSAAQMLPALLQATTSM